MIFDNASDNTGKWAGLAVLFEALRRADWEDNSRDRRDASRSIPRIYKPLISNGCDDHITALVDVKFHALLVEAGTTWELPTLIATNKNGKQVSALFQFYKSLSYRYRRVPLKASFRSYVLSTLKECIRAGPHATNTKPAWKIPRVSANRYVTGQMMSHSINEMPFAWLAWAGLGCFIQI